MARRKKQGGSDPQVAEGQSKPSRWLAVIILFWILLGREDVLPLPSEVDIKGLKITVPSWLASTREVCDRFTCVLTGSPGKNLHGWGKFTQDTYDKLVAASRAGDETEIRRLLEADPGPARWECSVPLRNTPARPWDHWRFGLGRLQYPKTFNVNDGLRGGNAADPAVYGKTPLGDVPPSVELIA